LNEFIYDIPTTERDNDEEAQHTPYSEYLDFEINGDHTNMSCDKAEESDDFIPPSGRVKQPSKSTFLLYNVYSKLTE